MPIPKWDSKDFTLVVEETIRLRHEDIESSLLQLIMQAQEILPQDKRRMIRSKLHVSDVIGEVKSRLLVKNTKNENERIETLEKEVRILREQLETRINRLANSIDEKIRKTKEVKKLSIVVSGILDSQIQLVKREIDTNNVTIKHIATDSKKHEHIPSGDYCILTDFNSHRLSIQCEQQFGKERCFYVGKGIIPVVNKIKELMSAN